MQKKIDDLYSVIAGVLANDKTIKTFSSLEEQDQKVRKLLSSQRTLLILDNLETVDDERLLDFILTRLPQQNSVTTRHWVSVAYPIKLEGMPYNNAQSLIDQQRKIGNVQLSEEETEKLIHLTGGVPLAIVWSIGFIEAADYPNWY